MQKPTQMLAIDSTMEAPMVYAVRADSGRRADLAGPEPPTATAIWDWIGQFRGCNRFDRKARGACRHDEMDRALAALAGWAR